MSTASIRGQGGVFLHSFPVFSLDSVGNVSVISSHGLSCRFYVHRDKSCRGFPRVRWQNQSWGGKLKFFRSVSFSRIFSMTHFLWNGRLHSAQDRESSFRSPSFCVGVFCLHKKQCVVGDGLGSRLIRALGVS